MWLELLLFNYNCVTQVWLNIENTYLLKFNMQKNKSSNLVCDLHFDSLIVVLK